MKIISLITLFPLIIMRTMQFSRYFRQNCKTNSAFILGLVLVQVHTRCKTLHTYSTILTRTWHFPRWFWCKLNLYAVHQRMAENSDIWHSLQEAFGVYHYCIKNPITIKHHFNEFHLRLQTLKCLFLVRSLPPAAPLFHSYCHFRWPPHTLQPICPTLCWPWK